MPSIANLKKKHQILKEFEKIIFIDRDGVINHDPIGDYIKSWKDFQFLPGVMPALKKLCDLDFKIIIISNQAGVGDRIFKETALRQITKNMISELKRNGIYIKAVYYCLHGKKAGCACRKPKTGLFEQAARDVYFNPHATFFIGDKETDVLAGKAFGLRTIMVLTGHGSIDVKKLNKKNMPDIIAEDLIHAVSDIEKEETYFP